MIISKLREFLGFGGGPSFRPVRAFAVLSFLSIAAITASSAYLQSRFLTNQILLRDATVTHEFLQSIVNAEGTAEYFSSTEQEGASEKLQSFFRHILKMPDVLAANVYDPGGRVLWSSNPEIAGAHYEDNDELKEALTGKLVFEAGIVGTADKEEHNNLAPSHIGSRFVETYVPIVSTGDNRVVGIVEVYKVPLALDRALSGSMQRLWLGAFLGGGLLFTTLFWIVRHAANVIAGQNRKLTEVQSMAMIGETAAAVTHSIRNPLASIRAAAEIALTDDLEGARESARDIITETDRLTRWTKELLLFSKHPFHESQTLDLDMNELVNEVMKDYAEHAGKSHIAISLDLAERLPNVQATAEPARHVLTSIVANAADAMPKGGKVTVRTQKRLDGKILLTVEDTGPGLNSEMMEKVMKPFFSTKSGGTGLGLPLSQQIMERFGGSLNLRKGEKGLAVEMIFLPAKSGDRHSLVSF